MRKAKIPIQTSILLATALSLWSCKAERPACSPERLAQIEVNFVNEAIERCKGHTFETCPDLAEIRAKYKVQREEWVACQ